MTNLEDWLLTTAVLLGLAPVWSVPVYLTQDGPAHIETSAVLASPGQVGREYFDRHLRPAPNWAIYVIEPLLLQAAPPAVADKIALSLYVVALPLAFRFAARGIGSGAQPAASALCFPLIYSCLFHYGFLNFCLGLAAALLTVGLAAREWRSGAAQWIALALAALATYFCHIVAFGFAVLLVASAIPWRKAARQMTAFLPAAALAIWFVAEQGSTSYGAPPVPLAARAVALFHFSTAVFDYSAASQQVSICLGTLFATALAGALWRHRLSRLLAAPIVIAVLYFAAPPATAGGQYILERLQLLLFLSIGLYAAAVSWSKRTAWVLGGLGLAGAGAQWIHDHPRMLALSRLASEYLEVQPHIGKRTVLLPIHFDSRGPGVLETQYGLPFRHISGYVAAARGSVDLDNYQAETALFPIRFKADRDPAVHMGGIEDEPPQPDLERYFRSTGQAPDYLILWDPRKTAPDFRHRAYSESFRSSGGSLRLFERR